MAELPEGFQLQTELPDGFTLQEQPSKSKATPISQDLAVAAGSAGVAGVAKAAKAFLLDPVQRANRAKEELMNLRAQFGISKDAALEKTIWQLNEKKKTAVPELAMKIDALKTGVTGDRTSKIANMIAENFQDINKISIENYGRLLDAADLEAEKVGFNFSNKVFSDDVIDKTISWAKENGVEPEKIKALEDIKKNLLSESKIVNESGETIGTKMSPKTAKTVVSNIIQADPYGRLSAKIRGVFGSFLEKAAPAEIKELYQNANDNYKPYAELRNTVNKYISPKTGEFDTRKMASFFGDYVKKGVDSGHSKIINFLSEGNEILPANPQFREAFLELNKVRGELDNLRASKPKIVNDISKASVRASDLLDVIEKNSINPIGKAIKAGIKTVVPTAGRFIGAMPMGVVEGEIQKRAVGYDPMQAFQAFMTGIAGSPEEKMKAQQEALRQYQEASTI